jgi:endonuclease-3
LLNKEGIADVLKELSKEYGNSKTALNFKSPFQLLVSTMLAAQSTDVQVNKVTKDLYKAFPDAKSFLKLSIEELENRIRTIGLFRSKARNILATCRMLVKKYNGKVPKERDQLLQLPGVGRKTANVVLSVAFNHDAIAVDTHVFRVTNRIGLAQAEDVLKTEKQLMENIPRNKWSEAHHWLIWHGRNVCKAQSPRCSICIISNYCIYFSNLNFRYHSII